MSDSLEYIMNRYSKILYLPIIIAYIISGCRTVPANSITETPQEVSQVTVEPSPMAALPSSPTSGPTDTSFVQPTFTPEAIQTLTTTSSTPFLVMTKFPIACQDEYFSQYTKISPDGNWLAQDCSYNGTMKVSNQDGVSFFAVDSRDYFHDPNFPELTGLVRPVHWTNDSRFIYFTVTPEQWNDGAYLSLDSFAPLLGRMDIGNGEIYTVLTGAFYHSFSPTDRRLIEIQEFEHPVKLIIHDLNTGLYQTLIPDDNPQYSQGVRVVWSPDGLKFVFVAAYGGEFGDEVSDPNIQSLILVDLENLSQRMILSEIPDFIGPVSWDENDMIVYNIMNYSDRYQITTYTYDYHSQEIIISPTGSQ